MANNKSSKKRIQINKRNNLQNKFYKTSIKNLKKRLIESVKAYKYSGDIKDKEKVQQLLNSSYSLIDKAKKTKVLHPNKANRNKARLANQLKAI